MEGSLSPVVLLAIHLDIDQKESIQTHNDAGESSQSKIKTDDCGNVPKTASPSTNTDMHLSSITSTQSQPVTHFGFYTKTQTRQAKNGTFGNKSTEVLQGMTLLY
jgi:hypothetical protein